MSLRFAVTLAAFFLAAAGILPARPQSMSARIVVQASPLAGYRYYDGHALWGDMKAGDLLRLVREPDNPHDRNAIRLEWMGHMVGYVPRRENADLARQMDHGAALEARIIELTTHRNGRRRMRYEIGVPLKY